MGILTTYEPDNDLMIRTVEGRVGIQDFIDALDLALDDPRFVKGMDAIWDFSGADLAPFQAGEITRLIEQIRQRSEQRGSGYRIALVAPQELISRMARVFEVKGKTLPASIRIHYSTMAARQWLANLPSK